MNNRMLGISHHAKRILENGPKITADLDQRAARMMTGAADPLVRELVADATELVRTIRKRLARAGLKGE